jgi:hypothetical protein
MLLRELGPRAIERIKRLLVLEISAEQRKRILDTIDLLTTDLMVEFVYAEGSGDCAQHGKPS